MYARGSVRLATMCEWVYCRVGVRVRVSVRVGVRVWG